MKDTELIRLMVGFIANSHDSGFIKKKAKECIEEITSRMDSEEEKRSPGLQRQYIEVDGDAIEVTTLGGSVQTDAKNAQETEQDAQSDEKPLLRSKDVVTKKPPGGGTAEVRHRKAESAPEGRLGSEEDRGRDEVLRGDDLQLHEEGRDQVNAVGR